jgi:hypothetical protein
MAELTTDPDDPRLGHGSGPGPQNQAYLVMSQSEIDKGYVRPLRRTYIHTRGAIAVPGPDGSGVVGQLCGGQTTMSFQIAATYAADPTFYGSTYCVKCRGHYPVREFDWSEDGTVVGS